MDTFIYLLSLRLPSTDICADDMYYLHHTFLRTIVVKIYYGTSTGFQVKQPSLPGLSNASIRAMSSGISSKSYIWILVRMREGVALLGRGTNLSEPGSA